MICDGCYKNGLCWACVKWFGCHKENPEAPTTEKPDGCFVCDKESCRKDKGDLDE